MNSSTRNSNPVRPGQASTSVVPAGTSSPDAAAATPPDGKAADLPSAGSQSTKVDTHNEAKGALRGVSSSSPLVLSDEDQQQLAQFHQKLQVVRDYVAAVALGYSTGLFLHGDGGI